MVIGARSVYTQLFMVLNQEVGPSRPSSDWMSYLGLNKVLYYMQESKSVLQKKIHL